MKKTLYTIFVISALLLSATALAQTVTNTTHNGTGPYSTIQDAINNPATVSGDVITISANTFNENVVVNKSVTLIGAGITSVIQPSSGYGISVSANDVTLQDLKVTGAGNHGIWAKDISGLKITSVTADGNSGSGIALQGVTDATSTSILTDVTATNNTQQGLEIGNGSTNVQVYGGTFTGNGTDGSTQYGGGIMIYADAGKSTNGTVIKGSVTASTNKTAGIYLYCTPGGTISTTTIGVGGTGSLTLNDNGSGGGSYGTGGAAILLFGGCDHTTITDANSTNHNTVIPTAGLVVLGTNATGSNSPTTTVVQGCTLTGFTSTSPAATMYAHSGSNTLICTNNVDATSNDNSINTFSPAQGYAVEDVLYHKLDNAQLGRFLGPGTTIYVTQNSGSIQRGIDAIIPPYTTVQVEGGAAYAENVTLNKAITLSGDGTATVITPTSGYGVNVTANSVTVCSLKVTGASKHGIWASGVTNLNIHDVSAISNGSAGGLAAGGASGIAVRGISGTSAITNIIATNNYNDGLEIGDGCNGLTVSGGTFSNNGQAGNMSTGGGIFIYSNTTAVSGITIGGTLTASGNTTAGIYIFTTPSTGSITGTAIGGGGSDAITLTNNGSSNGTNSGGAGVIVYGAATSTSIAHATFTQGAEPNGIGIVHVGTASDGTNSPSGTTVSNCTFNDYTSAAPAITNDLPLTAGLGPLHSNNDVAATTNTFKFLVNAKVFLQGPYNTGTSLMNTGLLTPTLRIPLSEPYSSAPWSYTGGETVGSIPALVVDWILLELRTGTASTTKIASRAAFLKNDGTVLEIDGTTGVTFTAVIASGYNVEHYIVIRHRNHLAIMSAAIAPYPTQYDFTTAMGQAFGTVTTELTKPMKDLTGSGPFAMFAGDVTSNGTIKLSGASNDKDPIYTRIGSGLVGATTSGYYNEDTNMNGQVKLSGASNDADVIYSNIGGGLVGATRPSRVP